MKILKKYSVKIPKNVKIIYLYNKNCVVFIGPVGRKFLKLKLKLLIHKSKNLLYVIKKSDIILSKKQKKLFNSLQGTITALLKQALLEVSIMLFKKLKLIGVGYRLFISKINRNFILHFKLGFSHFIFFKIDPNIKVLSFKPTNLYMFGNSYNQVSQLASKIRSYKFPEPYKGKGILYQNEKIELKEGKKI